ncbi:MAG: hypothetical protein KAH95_15625 [Spirochaetales bacterium]|nr:hypothetical protein [Spirochaetales bacterium]
MSSYKNPDNINTRNLIELIEKKKKENKLLTDHKKNLQHQTSRYRKIFDKSYISIWEGDAENIYKIIESLPCNNGKELTEYLSTHNSITRGLIRLLKIVDFNDYTLQLFETDNKDELSKSLRKIVTIYSIPGCIKAFSDMKDGLIYSKHEIAVYTISGRKLNLLYNVYLPGRGNGNILTSMMDITERKLNEEDLKHTVELAKEQKKRTEVLQNILFTLTYSLDKEIILNAILLEAKKIVPYSTANIRLLENKILKVVASVGYDKYGADKYIHNSSINLSELGNAEDFLNTGNISIISDTRINPHWSLFPETSFIRGYIGIPFKLKDKVSGLISLDSDSTDTFSNSDIEKLEPFAHAVTVALQNSYLFETTKIELEKRRQIENSLKKFLGEKEILLKEIHHRVKNNLALVMSLINLQSDVVLSEINPDIFENLKQRVYTISLVHELLYSSKNLSSVNLESYIIDLTDSIKGTSFFKNEIKFQILIRNSIELEADTLVPLALLLNELLINSVKHAFPDKTGTITIIVSSDENNKYTIIIKDNGIGFPKQKKESTSLLGLDLVESMTAQLNGTVSFENNNGAVSTIVFPQK